MSKWDRRLAPFLRRGRWDDLKMHDAILESSLGHSEKLVTLAIVSHRSNDRPFPSPGVRRLAALTSQKTDTVLATIARLEQRGLIRVERHHRQAHSYDLSPLMTALLAVPPIGTAGVRKEGTGAVPPIGTVSEPSVAEGCPDPGGQGVPIQGVRVSQKREPKEPMEGTNGRNQIARRVRADAPDQTFSLVAPKTRAPRKRKRTPTKSERPPEQRADHQRVVAQYFSAFEEKTGKKPEDFDSADGDAVWKLYDKLKGNVELACERVRNAVLSDFGGSTSLRVIAHDPKRFCVLNKRGNGKPERFVQKGGFDVERAGSSQPWEAEA